MFLVAFCSLRFVREKTLSLVLAFCLLRFGSAICSLRLLQDLLRFASRHLAFCFKTLAFCFKARCILLQSSLHFASKLVAFCFKTCCVLLQDILRFASRLLRFASKLVAFCFKARCVLLQSSLRFASRHTAFCFKTSCVLLQDSCVLSQDSCDLSHGGTAFCLLLKTLSAFWSKEFLAKFSFRTLFGSVKMMCLQAPIQHPQVEPTNEFSTYKKITETSIRAIPNQITNLRAEMKNEIHSLMQNQINNVKNELRSNMSNQTNELRNMMASFFQKYSASTLGSKSLLSNTITNPRGDLKAITTQSGVSYDGPPIPPPFSSLPMVVEWVPEVTKDTVQPSTKNIQPLVVQNQVPINDPFVGPKPKMTIPYPSRVTKQKLCEKDNNLAINFVEVFRKLHFDLSFADALFHIPKFALLFESLLNNKEKLFDLAMTSLSLPKLTPMQMILELADRSMTRPAGIAEDVFVKVGKFYFPTDVVVDYVVDPRVPLILRRPFLRTGRALIDVYGEELTLRVDDEAITFKVGQTSKYSYNDAESINRIDVIDIACEEYVQEVLGFFDNSNSGNPTLIFDPIIALSSPSLTPFEGGDFILEEIKACLTSKLIPSGIDDTDFDLEGDIQEIKTLKSSIDEPPKLELKELSSHLEYAFLEGTDKIPVIIYKELKDKEKSVLLKVLKSHKRAIAWKISDIKGIDPRFYTYKILMKDDFKPAVQQQRRVNLKIHEVTKKEVIKLFDAGLSYPIFDSPWVNPVHCVPKKGGMTVIENEDNELIPTRLASAAIFTKMRVLQIGTRAMVIENKSSNHPMIVPSDFDIEDAFSSTNSPNYLLEISPKDIKTSVSPSSSVGSSSPVRSTVSPLDYPFDESIFAELDNSLWITPRSLGEEPVPEEPNESDTHLWK
nr:DNA-directed DNA polymerase [Tanacetum cinerariifolium]